MPSNKKGSKTDHSDIQDDIKQLLLGQKELKDALRELKQDCIKKDDRIKHLEARVNVLEQQAKINDVVVVGMKTTHQSWARKISTNDNADDDEEAPQQEKKDLERQVIDYFSGKNISVDSNTISTVYTKKSSSPKSPKTIVVQFVSNKAKLALLRQSKKLKGTKVYLNEHLTFNNASLFRTTHKLRKSKTIKDTFTRNGKVFIVTKGNSPEESKLLLIKSIHDLETNGFDVQEDDESVTSQN